MACTSGSIPTLFRGRPGRRLLSVLLAAAALIASAEGAVAQTLRGSPQALSRQNRQARAHDFTFLRGETQLDRFVRSGLLVRLPGNDDYLLHDVSFEVARPEVRLFVERLSSQYRRACGEPLVVTSLTRPASHQPSNASARSVHPTGMALDLRQPSNGRCRSWLESTLLHLDGRNVLDATREANPAHYHVALFPAPYVSHVARLTGTPEAAVLADASRRRSHTVRRGENLTQIGRRYGVTARALQQANALRSTTIHAGQVLTVPRP